MCGIAKKQEWLELCKQKEGGRKQGQRGHRGGYVIQGLGGQCKTLTFTPSEMEAAGGFRVEEYEESSL